MPKKTKLASKRINSILPADVRGAINVLCEEFEETKDPLALMGAFIRSVHAGISPPAPILQAIAKAFLEVIYSGGRKGGSGKTVDEALGIQGARRGSWDVFTRQKKEIETYSVALMIWRLTVGYERTSIMDAAERVSLFLEERKKHPRVIPRFKHYSAEYLRDEYSGSWKKKFHLDNIELTSDLHPASWPAERRAVYLSMFPSPKS